MNFIRRPLEMMSRRVVLHHTFTKRFSSAKVAVSPGSALRYWRGDLESLDPNILNWVEEFVKPGDVVWDIGANVGLFSFAAAAIAGPTGRVLAIEPDLWLVKLLRLSVSFKNEKLAPVTILPLAISDTERLAELKIAARGRCSNFLGEAGNSQTGGIRETQTALAVTLDWLLNVYPAPRVVKIDVEAHEHCVLSGASKILAEHQPVMHIEVSAENSDKVSALLSAFNYSIFDADEPPESRSALNSASFNTVAVPNALLVGKL